MGCISGNALFFGNYISPFYSPKFSAIRRTVGLAPSRLVARLASIFPALLMLWAPAGFRLTCYYYRGAYYKAFWATRRPAPSASRAKLISGERSFPLIMQNVHRYFLYLALVFIVILTIDVWKALWFVDPQRQEFWDRVGTIVSRNQCDSAERLYFGCHSLRHLAADFSINFEIATVSRLRVRELFNRATCFGRG
jgi:hypothetical protein